MSFIADYRDLQPNQWFIFSHETETIPAEFKGGFNVLTREDTPSYNFYVLNHRAVLYKFKPTENALTRIKDIFNSAKNQSEKQIPGGYQICIISDQQLIGKFNQQVAAVKEKVVPLLGKLKKDVEALPVASLMDAIQTCIKKLEEKKNS